MRRATVTIPEELEKAMESYRGDLDFPPSLAQLTQAALAEYLSRRGYDTEGSSSGRPTMMEDAPRNKGGKTAAEVVIEDRS
jgi:hypothetical protein